MAFQMIFEEVQYRLPGLVTAPFCPPFLQRARGTSTDKMVRACGAKRSEATPLAPVPLLCLGPGRHGETRNICILASC